MPPVEGDDIHETQFYNGIHKTTSPTWAVLDISAFFAISFMCFDLCTFSPNAFLSAKDVL
jgi:hypothetical protein